MWMVAKLAPGRVGVKGWFFGSLVRWFVGFLVFWLLGLVVLIS